jgi:hypothetical protein
VSLRRVSVTFLHEPRLSPCGCASRDSTGLTRSPEMLVCFGSSVMVTLECPVRRKGRRGGYSITSPCRAMCGIYSWFYSALSQERLRLPARCWMGAIPLGMERYLPACGRGVNTFHTIRISLREVRRATRQAFTGDTDSVTRGECRGVGGLTGCAQNELYAMDEH